LTNENILFSVQNLTSKTFLTNENILFSVQNLTTKTI